MAAAYLNLKTIQKRGGILIAARHNLREIQAELGADSHIDPARTSLNLVLEGPLAATDVADMATQAIEDARAKTQKNTVFAVEIVVTLPPHSIIQTQAFFADALAWAHSSFNVPVLSAVVHMDEEAPHMHVLILPLKNGRMCGSELMGDKVRLSGLQSDFHRRVASRYGLSRPHSGKRISAAAKKSIARTVMDHLRDAPEKLKLPNVRHTLEQIITSVSDPGPLLASLGLEMPTSPAKKGSFIGTMTKPVKPEPKNKPYRKPSFLDELSGGLSAA